MFCSPTLLRVLERFRNDFVDEKCELVVFDWGKLPELGQFLFFGRDGGFDRNLLEAESLGRNLSNLKYGLYQVVRPTRKELARY